MAEPIKNVTLGGLTYNANQVKKAMNNGDGTYTIFFKTGETLTYPEQPALRALPEDKQKNGEMLPNPKFPGGYYNSGAFEKVKPHVSQKISDGWISDNVTFDICDVMGASFTSHKDNVAAVNLENSVDCTIDLAANNSKHYGDKAVIKGGRGNEVIMDKKDSMRYSDIPGASSSQINGPGTEAQDSER